MQASTLSVTPNWDHIALDLFRLAPALPKETEGTMISAGTVTASTPRALDWGTGARETGVNRAECQLPLHAGHALETLAMREAKYGVDLGG